MKTLLTLLILLASVSAFADNEARPDLLLEQQYLEILHKAKTKHWSISIEPYMMLVAFDNENIVKGSKGFEFTTYYNKWKVSFTQEEIEMKWMGQSGDPLDLYSLNIGIEKRWDNGWEFSMDVGAYMIQGDGIVHHYLDTQWEGYCRWMNQIAYHSGYVEYFDNYFAEYSPGVGAKISLGYTHKFTKQFSAGLNVKVRYLQLKRHVRGYYDGREFNSDLGLMYRWDRVGDADFSGALFAVKARYDFNRRHYAKLDMMVNENKTVSPKLTYNISLQKKARKVVRKGEVVYIR